MVNLLSELDMIKTFMVTWCEKLNLYKHFNFKSVCNFLRSLKLGQESSIFQSWHKTLIKNPLHRITESSELHSCPYFSSVYSWYCQVTQQQSDLVWIMVEPWPTRTRVASRELLVAFPVDSSSRSCHPYDRLLCQYLFPAGIHTVYLLRIDFTWKRRAFDVSCDKYYVHCVWTEFSLKKN